MIMSDKCRVAINADDFGLTDSSTEAIALAFREGLITDTTMVANGKAFDRAIEMIHEQKLEDRIGIHFNLTQFTPLTNEITKYATFVHHGEFHGKINRLKFLTKQEQDAVYEEMSAQISKLENAGLKITHADSHHHIHTDIFIAPIFARVCEEHGIRKVRLHRNIGVISQAKQVVKKAYNHWLHRKGFRTFTYFGSMDDVECAGIKDALEIMVHPEFDAEGNLIDKIDQVNGKAIGRSLTLPNGDYQLLGYKDL